MVKTTRFTQPKYVGDPLNAVRIFNEKAVDELMVLDIDATTHNREPDYDLIGRLASECRMPLSYGGGVNSIEQIERIIGLGVEKVALSSAAVRRPAVVAEAAERVGSQSVVVVLDVKTDERTGVQQVFVENGRQPTGLDPVTWAQLMQERGAGEIVINSIDRDGTMEGYDLELAQKVRNSLSVPMTVLGGAGSMDHIGQLIHELGIVGAAAGSLFVFKGRYRAVLITYPSRKELDALGIADGITERVTEIKGPVKSSGSDPI